MTDDAKLTLKQQLFVEAYLGAAKGNATEAARLAGYKGNDQTLASVGAENLKKPQIASRVRARVDAAAMTADEVLKELSEVARSEWRDHVQIVYGSNGEILDAKLQLKDKVRALELIGKHHKLFVDQLDVTTKGQAIPVLNIYASETGKPHSGD